MIKINSLHKKDWQRGRKEETGHSRQRKDFEPKLRGVVSRRLALRFE